MNAASTTAARSALLALPALGLLVACPPLEPPLGPEPGQRAELRSGAWSLELEGIELEGRCDELSPRELEGTVIEGWLKLGPERAIFDLDGVVLRGRYADRWLDVAGTLEDQVGVVVGEDEEAVGLEEEDEAAPPPCMEADEDEDCEEEEEEHRPDHEELWVELSALAVGPERMEGSMAISYDLPDLRCTVYADVYGHFMGEDRPGQEEPRPDEDEPRDDGDGDGGDRDGGDCEAEDC